MESFITKCKGSTDNNNLPRLGKLTITKTDSDINSFIIYADQSDFVEISSDGSISTIYLPGSQSDVSLPYRFKTAEGFNTKTFTLSSPGNLYIGDKYSSALWSVSLTSKPQDNTIKFKYELKDLVTKYNNQVNTRYFSINFEHLTGNIEELNKLPNECTNIMMNFNDIKGNIASFNKPSSLEGLSMEDTPGITGTVSDLGKFGNLKTLNILRTSITGSIEGMIESMVSSGVTSRDTSNTLFSNGILSQLTFGGIIQPYNRSFGHITWNGTSKIVIYCGDSQLANCTIVYAKGASQSEIDAWTSAGKTVYVIS